MWKAAVRLVCQNEQVISIDSMLGDFPLRVLGHSLLGAAPKQTFRSQGVMAEAGPRMGVAKGDVNGRGSGKNQSANSLTL